jgi:hypothetical protein
VARAGKYARLELERRFLLADVPAGTDEAGGRRIHDRYIISRLVGAESEEELASHVLPEFALAEVSDDIRFTGGALAAATPVEAAALASAYSSRSRARR